MLRAVVTYGADGPEVLLTAEEGDSGATYSPDECEFAPEPGVEFKDLSDCGPGPSPIAPEVKELAWGAGSFLLFAIVLRYLLYPRLRRSMDARYASVADAHTSAEKSRSDARSEVEAYERALAEVRAEAAAVVDAARTTVESERSARLAEANERIAGRREAAMAEAGTAHDAARADIGTAVAMVAARSVEVVTGAVPDPVAVSRVVDELMNSEVSR